MLQALNLRQYRGFASYQLADLARVNLLVGGNNAGKTSILEGLELLLSGGNPSALIESAKRRGEFSAGSASQVDLSHVFYGHECTPGAFFELAAADKSSLTGKILLPDDDLKSWKTMQERLWAHDPDKEIEAAFGLCLGMDSQRPAMLPLKENGALIYGYWMRSQTNGHVRSAVHFLNLNLSSMQSAWNAVLAKKGEAELVEAMRILIPEIGSIQFLVGGHRENILVGEEGVQVRVPMGSYGDGVQRLLAISLALVGTKNGCILIDEIDTGLHWTVMQDVWRLVVETAQRYGVQVFATTHSYDCIRGLGSLIQSRPDLSESVAIQKVHRSLEKAVCIPGEDIPIVVEQDIEVR